MVDGKVGFIDAIAGHREAPFGKAPRPVILNGREGDMRPIFVNGCRIQHLVRAGKRLRKGESDGLRLFRQVFRQGLGHKSVDGNPIAGGPVQFAYVADRLGIHMRPESGVRLRPGGHLRHRNRLRSGVQPDRQTGRGIPLNLLRRIALQGLLAASGQ